MRDPAATKAEIEAAIEGACKEFGWLKGRGWFPKKLPFDNQLRYEARLSPDAERGDAAEGSAGRAGEPICLQHCDESARARWRAHE